jgi:transmembrane sensor
LLAWAGLGGATAASLVAFGVVAPAFGAITTGKGEVRLVPLDDGSSVMLNTETSLKVRFSDRERRIQLYYGEAYFTIVHDPRRAFVVDVADAHLRAAPGAFRVRDLSGKPLDVLVNQGSLTLHSASEPAAILMRPNTRLILSAGVAESVGPIPQTITPDLVSRELAWRDGKIAFEGERLDQAAAEFGRYSRVRIEISDPALAGEPVSGLFAAGDPVGFSRAIGNIFDTNIVLHDNIVTINRRDKQD